MDPAGHPNLAAVVGNSGTAITRVLALEEAGRVCQSSVSSLRERMAALSARSVALKHEIIKRAKKEKETTTKPKVLALHGYMQNRETFQARTGAFRKALKSRIDLVYLNAPFKATALPEDAPTADDAAGDGGSVPRSWWTMAGEAQDGAQYGGFEGLYDKLIAEISQHSGPLGLFGFSQGASSIGLLLARVQASKRDRHLLSRIKFVILVSSFLPRNVTWAAEIQAGLPPNVRSLHVYGESDELVTMDRSVLLEEVYARATVGNSGSTVHHVHPGGHLVPTCTGTFRDVTRAFIDDCCSCAST